MQYEDEVIRATMDALLSAFHNMPCMSATHPAYQREAVHALDHGYIPTGYHRDGDRIVKDAAPTTAAALGKRWSVWSHSGEIVYDGVSDVEFCGGEVTLRDPSGAMLARYAVGAWRHVSRACAATALTT